jgi:8-oxo-dGTP diphosphatase
MKKFGEKVEGVRYLKRVGCYGVIVKDGLLGVMKSEESATYFLTGGGIEDGEDERNALRREALEEIGYEIEILEKTGEAEEYFYLEKEQKYIVQECRFYRISLLTENKTKSKYELVWIAADELENLHHESYRWIVEKELGVLARTQNPHK